MRLNDPGRLAPLVVALTLLAPQMRGQYSNSEIASVQVSAVVQASPPRITLNWPSFPTATGYTLYRKLHSSSSWGSSIATLGAAATSHQDNSVSLDTHYEYKVVRASSLGTGYGYVSSGIELAATEYNGKVVLLVDNTISAALAAGLTQLEMDLKGEGWVVIRHDVSPGASVSSVRTTLAADYNADQTNVKCVYIIGHVPVPYSGNIAPDDHTEQHKGAWPCDSYYGEVTGTWTDATVNNTTGWDANKNIPGDGKFDQDSPPNTVELQVGRVDMYDLPAFSQTATQLISNYLTKAHAFRTKAFTPQTRAIMRDHLEDLPHPLAGSGWMSFAGMVGQANVTEIAYNAGTWLRDLVDDQSYLWTYGSGGGLIGNDNGVLMFNYTEFVNRTIDLAAAYEWGGVFNMQMCSYTGDWNNRNNVFRALIANGQALTNVYTGNPNWWFHPMAMGQTIGHCVRLSMNNGSVYTPQSGGFLNPAPRGAMGLMGDPTLKLFYVSPPTGLVVSNNGGNASFLWSAAEGSPAGYHVYAFDAGGVPVRLNANLITGTSFNSAQAYSPGAQFMVRAVKLETTASGSHWNLSIGAQATAPAVTSVQVAPRMVLEGPYNSGTGLMSDALRTAALIPLAEPYSALGFAVIGGGGETIAPAVLNTTGANAPCDWVRVELRSSGAPGTVLAAKHGLLQRDGDVVGTDGSSPLSFNVAAGNYHVAVRHRNHLGAMTASPVALSTSSTLVDFKSPAMTVYGTGALKTIGAIRALWTGNTVHDAQLKYAGANNDRDLILTRVGSTTPNAAAPGYFIEDVNLDGVVEYTSAGNDRDPILVNVGSTTPNSVRVEQLP